MLDSELAVAVVCKKDTKNNRYIYNIKLNWESIKDIETLYVSDVEVFWVTRVLPNLVGIIKMHIFLVCFSIALVTLTSMTWICKQFNA